MDRRLLIALSLLLLSALSYGNEKADKNDYYNEDYDYTYDDGPEESIAETGKQNTNTTTIRPATYEVTENVVDTPNTSTKLGPIIVNFTTARPLNNAENIIDNKNISENPVNFNNRPTSNYGFEVADNDSVNAKKNYFSIFHVKAEYDDKPGSSTPNYQTTARPGFKDYILGLKRGIVNGLYNLFNKKQIPESNEHLTEHESVHHKFYSESSHARGFGHGYHSTEDEYD